MKPVKPAKKPKSEKKQDATTRFETKKQGGQGPSLGEKLPQKSGEVGNKKPPIEHQFKPGNLANPGGKPIGARNRLQGDFLRDLSEDFAANGKTAIIACRTEKPDVYVKIVASLMPKELAITRPLDDLTDDELDNAIALLRERLGATANAGKGMQAAQGREQADTVPAVH